MSIDSLKLSAVQRFGAFSLTLSLLLVVVLATGCNKSESSSSDTQPSLSATHSHENAGETCFICDPAKRDSGRLWCKDHERYEDRCWECHPELRDTARPFCEEHGLYEDECFLCDPSRAATSSNAEEAALSQSTELFCNEHQVPENQCGICQTDLVNSLPVGGSLLVRMPSDRSGDLAGVATSRPIQEDAHSSVPLLGEIRFDGNRHAKVTALSGGVLAEVRSDLGATVKAGEVLAIIQSPGIAEARADYLAAQADLEMRESAAIRQRRLLDERIGSRREMEEAEAAFRRAEVANRLARQQLLNLGITETDIETISEARSDLPLRAPFSGTIVKRTAVLGEAVDAGASLFEVANLREMWVEIAVPEEHAPHLKIGTPIQVAVRGIGDRSIGGRITWVGPVVDHRTRMVRARGVIPNEEGTLRDGMFVDVRAIVGQHPESVRLSTASVQRINNQPFVFVRQEPDLFAARRVELGDRLESDEFVVYSGVSPSDDVVLDGSFVVKSALLASRLGAGCADE